MAVKRSLIASACGLVVAGLLCGCDNRREAEKVADLSVGEARGLLGKSDLPAELSGKLTEIGNGDAGSATKLQAKALLAEFEYGKAVASAAKLAKVEADIARLTLEIAQRAQSVSSSNALVAGVRATEPKTLLDEIAKSKTDAEGSGGAGGSLVWTVAEGSSLPSLAAVNQQIAKLGVDIADKTDKQTKAEADRTAALTESETLQTQSEAKKGRESVDLYKQASDARKKAGDLAIQIETLKSQKIPLEQDLALAQSQKASLEGALKMYTDTAATTSGAWDARRALADSRTKAARDILDGAKSAGPTLAAEAKTLYFAPGESIANKAKVIEDAAKEADELRNAAVASLGDAIKDFGDAADLAGKYATEVTDVTNKLGDRNDAAPLKAAAQVTSIARFQYQKGVAEQALGNIRLAEAASVKLRLDAGVALAAIATEAGGTLPPAFGAEKLKTQLDAAVDQASAKLKDGADDFASVVENASRYGKLDKELAQSANIAQVFALFNQYQLAKLLGKADDAAKLLENASVALRNFGEAGTRSKLPTLPVELQGVLPPPSAAETPATAPAVTPPVEGATPPADGATPATPPAEGTTPAPAKTTPPTEGTTPATPPADGTAPTTPTATPPVDGTPATPPAPTPTTPPAAEPGAAP